MPFIFNAVEFCVVTINEKPWTRASEVCKALEYGKATKTADIVKAFCNRENYAHKWQLSTVHAACIPINWPKDSRKDDYYINEEGMYIGVFFVCLKTGTKNFLTQKELKKMSLSFQRSVVESFKFNDKHVRSVYVKDVGQCLVSKDVYEAIGYGKEDGVKAIQRLVPEKYNIRFGDAHVDLEGVDNSVHT